MSGSPEIAFCARNRIPETPKYSFARKILFPSPRHSFLRAKEISEFHEIAFCTQNITPESQTFFFAYKRNIRGPWHTFLYAKANNRPPPIAHCPLKKKRAAIADEPSCTFSVFASPEDPTAHFFKPLICWPRPACPPGGNWRSCFILNYFTMKSFRLRNRLGLPRGDSILVYNQPFR